MDKITRRQFLRAAGGVTFLALVPTGKGLFAASTAGASVPLFIVPPYIQPGPASKLVDGGDTLVVAWQTEDSPAEFTAEYGLSKSYGQTASIVRGERAIGGGGGKGKKAIPPIADNSIESRRINYHAVLTGLSLGKTYHYRVKGNGQTIAEGYAATRKPRGQKIRFVTFGDNSYGDISDRAIAYYAYQARPDFVMNTGDNVYESGLDNEYARYFFPAYNADLASPHDGAPLLRSVPFYTVIANHDVNGKSDMGSVANFDTARDSLGLFTAMHLPLNGPANLSQPPPVVASNTDILDQFKACAGDRFPRMANYSFDYGDAHFLCLDSNDYVDPTDSALQAWIESDLAGTDAVWKFVVYHHPAFNVGNEHYREQHMRVLSPLFEKHSVDMCFHGHEHTYQRTQPLRFAPKDSTNASAANGKDRRVPGDFTIDTKFDGEKVTKPDGILYITTGAGGKELYEPAYTDNPSAWLHEDDNNVAYCAKFYSRLHSLTVIDLDSHTLTLTQINELGQPIDRIRVTKA
ncbi:MAG TPA: metallophosphoesterase [Capsulimonadaceae bacterium]|nr:metallophosphoesterase [Capsulimonadaceae bacterium]